MRGYDRWTARLFLFYSFLSILTHYYPFYVCETGQATIIILLQLVQDSFQLEDSQLALARRWLWSQEHENPPVDGTKDWCQYRWFQNGF